MWIVLKFKRKEQNHLVKELKEKVGKDVKIYVPKINLKLFTKNKVVNSKKNHYWEITCSVTIQILKTLISLALSNFKRA